MKVLNAALGFYFPSFFMAKINTKNRLDRGLEISEQITLLHEYVHFIDDISTTFGLINFCNTIDTLKVIIKKIYESKEMVCLPLVDSDLSVTHRENIELFSHYYGESKYESLYGNCKVVELVRKDIATKIQRNNFSSYELKINKGGVEEIFYRFGSICLSESLARIIERTFCSIPIEETSLPYDSAGLVVGKLYPSLAANTLNIASLCEVSLMTYNPGETFINSLIEMKKVSFNPASYSDIYNFVNDCFVFDGGLKIEDVYSESFATAVSQASDVFTVKELAHCSKLLIEYFEKARAIRTKSPLLITDLINGASIDQVNSNFLNLFSKVGLPFLYNDDGMCFVDARNESAKVVQFCHAIKAIFDIISSAKASCDMIEVCLKSDIDMKIDRNCHESPWRRSVDGSLCPVGVLWHSWSLDGKELAQRK